MVQGDVSELGEFIRRERERVGLGMRQLAELCGISAGNLSRIEAGLVRNPVPHNLQQIARHLGCDYEDLAMLAGWSLPEGLPNLPVYLRTQYGELTAEEIDEVEGYVRYLRNKHHPEGVGDAEPAD